MTWVITYQLPAIEGGAELTVTMAGDWCEDHGIRPADLDTPEQAAWALMSVLAVNGQDDAELITIEDHDTGALP